MINKLKEIFKGNFIRNVGVLAGGSAISQVIAVACSPILSRIFTQEDFGVYGVFTSTLSILIILGSLKYEIAITVANDERKSFVLMLISMLFLFILSIILVITVYFINDEFLQLLNLMEIKSFLWYLPIGLAGMGVYQILNYYAINNSLFKSIARTKLTQVSIMLGVQMVMGYFTKFSGGLIIGDIAGRFGGIGSLTKANLGKMTRQAKVSFKELGQVMVEYKNYPLKTLPASLLHNIINLAPVILITMIYGTDSGGNFSLGFRILNLPLVLVGQAIAQVFLKKSAELRDENPKELLRFFDKLVMRISLFSIIPFGVIAIISPYAFEFIFGEGWHVAGEFVSALCLGAFAQLVVGPVYNVLNVLGKQSLMLLADVIGFVLLVIVFYQARYAGYSEMWTVLFYSVSVFVTFFLLFLFSRYAIKRLIRQN